jgi:6-phosphogluconate dehydrogenase
MPEPCDIGLIGLGVMGQNLALNIADHGYRIAVFNRTFEVTSRFIAGQPSAHTPLDGELVPCETLEDLLGCLRRPRIVIVLVKAGAPIDAVCESLLRAGIEPADMVVDCGNSRWTDTIRREREYRGRLVFFGSGISGGELGARFGPSLMPGGEPEAWERLRPIWEAIAARVDPQSGRPIHGAAPGRPVAAPQAEPCAAYIGPDGAGHYVKMVHNGIEYADMQLIAEAYHLLRSVAGMSPEAIGEVFAEWNRGELESYLIEITADILRQRDPVTGAPLVDVVLDAAEQKGTGRWTAEHALELGVPAMTIAEAVFARAMSALKEQRVRAASILSGGEASQTGGQPGPTFVAAVRDALYCSKLCAYAQGFELMAAAQLEHRWSLDFASIAKIWRGGCIIRAVFLQKVAEAFGREARLPNLLLDPYFAARLRDLQGPWREVAAAAVRAGIPTPGIGSALAYFDGFRSASLPANLIQAQRDYFGAHSFERVDQPRGRYFHIDWPAPGRPQIEVE